MRFKESPDDVVYTDDLYYDLIGGGYIKPERILVDQQDITRVQNALDIIEDFLEGCIDNGFVEVV